MPKSVDRNSIPEATRFVIEEQVGLGGMGGLFRARAREDDQQVALKLLPVWDQEVPAHVLHEFNVLQKLDHPNVLRAIELFRMDKRIYVATELFNGIDSTAMIDPPAVACSQKTDRLLLILAQVLDALAHVHSKGIVHGDIKPFNILVDDSLHTKIVEFGLARYTRPTEEDPWEPGCIAGTANYMAPEQIRGDAPHISTDVFALGVCIFHWLYGTQLFRVHRRSAEISDVFRERTGTTVDVEYLLSKGASRPIASVLSKMLCADPAQRCTDYSRLLSELRHSLNQSKHGAGAFGRLLERIAEPFVHRPKEVSDSRREWDVAISFAGADRDTARQLADELKKRKVTVFYDVDHQSRLLGGDLLSLLHDIYTRRAKFCILLISQHYPRSDWAWFESRHVLKRAMSERSASVLPIRMDDTRLDGLPDSIAHIDLRKMTLPDAAEVVAQKVTLTANVSVRGGS